MILLGLGWWLRGIADRHWWEQELARAEAAARKEGQVAGQAASWSAALNALQQVTQTFPPQTPMPPWRSNKPDRGRHAAVTGHIPKIREPLKDDAA